MVDQEVEVPELPEVRQCQNPEDRNYGCVAVKSSVPYGKWFAGNPGVINPTTAGGHWEIDDSTVENWQVLA